MCLHFTSNFASLSLKQISSRNVLAMVATNGLRPGDVRRKRWGASINGNINPMGLLGRAASAHLLSANRNCHHSGSQLGPAGARKLAAELSAAPPRVASVDLSLCNLIGLDEHAHGVLDLGGFSALCNALLRNKRITSLNLGWNRMGADAMPFLKPVLEANPSLTVLDLYKNDIEDDGMRILAPCLDYLHLLQELNLRYNRIGSGGAAILAENLQYMSHLTTLDVAGNAIDAEGLKVLVPALTPLSRRARLASVHLQDNAGGVEGNHVLVGYVVQSSKYLRELNGLKLDHLMGLMVSHEDKLPNRFENYEALYLAEELDRAKDADLNEDEVDSPSVSRLYSVLSQSLSDIDLSWCHLTEFPEAILTLTSLQVLDISHNLLERIPVMKICAITSLTELQCSGNYNLAHPPAEISDQGGTAVMFYLKETIHSGIPDDEVALIALGAESVGKSSCLSCLITGVGRSVGPSTVKVNQSWQDSKDREFEDGTPIFRGEPLFDHALLDTLHERLEKDACPLNINDRDDSYLTLPEGTIVSNMVYWRAADDLQFNVVDLPGHSFYSAINRLFFRRRAVYLLVWRVTDFDSDEAMAREMIPVCNEVCAAMDFVQAVFPGANCLAVATHIDVTDTLKVAKQSQIVCKAIRRKLEEMKTQCEGGMSGLRVFNDGYSTFLSCKSGDGIPNLRKDLISFTRGLEVFKSQFPKSFLQLRNALRLVQKRLSLLKFSLYKALAKICGVHGKAFDVATKMLHERKYLNYYDDEYVLRRLHTAKLKLKTLIRLHLTMGGNLKKVQQKTFTRNSQAEGDDGIVIINPHWLVGVFRGLLVPDIELLIDWFSGVLNQKHFNPRLLQSTLNYITKGILERKLVYFLWPGSNKLVHKQFWAAYADRGIGPLKVHEGNLVSQDDEYDFLLDILAEHKIISKMTAESFWVPCMQMAVHARAGTSVMTDARVFKPIKQGISSEIRFNYLPPDFFPVLMATCAGVKDHWSNAGIDQLDYSPVAAAVYLKGDKAQISISRAPRANYYTVTLSASTLNLAHDIIDRLHMVEHVYPGMVRFSKTVEDNDPMVKPEEVPNILFLYSLHAVPHTEILIQEVRKYDLRCKVTSAQASQYSKILASLSIAGRDMIRSRHVNTMSKLRAYTTSWSTSTHGVLSRDKLTKHGFNESDTRLIYSPLVTEAFYGQVVILCLDNLYQDDAECDWHPVVKHVQGGAHLIVILLPGCQKVESLPVKPVSIIDLRFADWIQEGRELRLPYEARVALKNRLEPLTQRLMKNWRGNPEVVEHFDPPPISCNECLLGGQLLRQRFDVPEHVNLHHRFLMEQLKTGDFSQDEAPIFCINGHANQLETVLSETTRLSVTACPACIEQGKSLPYCFSRQSCVEVLHGKRHLESHDTPAPAPASEAPASEVHASEAQAVAAAKSAVAGPMLRCPHCKSEQLDLVDILQAEVFVSYSKKKIKCTSCGKGKIIHADDHVHANEHGKQQTQKKSPVRLRSPRHDERLARTGSAAFAHAGSASSAAFAHAGPASSRPTLTHLPQSWPTLTHSPLAFTPSAESHDISKGNYGSAVPLLCQECKTEFDLDAIDPLIACVQGAVGHLEEHLDILAVKPSTLYQIKEVTPTVGLLKAARNATVFVAFMDSHYVKSSTCMAEFSEAVMAGRTIIPVLLPGYSGGANWYPPDTKYKRGDGVNMIAPFTVLKNFLPINVDYDDEGSGEDSKLATALLKGVCVGLYGGVSHSQRTRQKYAEFRKRRILLCTNLLGVWAKLEPEEIDRKIARLWRRHAGSLDQIPQVKQQLASFGIKTSGPEIEIALAEISVTLKTMGAAEFRQFMWNLISNVMIKAEQSEDAKI